MAIHFPLIDIRQTIEGTWQQDEKNEIITVPLSGDYIVDLIEVPDNGQVSGYVTISGLTATSFYPPPAGYFFINYERGKLAFNQAQAGQSFTVHYYGKGSLVEAADINYLYNTTIELSAALNNIDNSAENIHTKTTTYNTTIDDNVLLLDASSSSFDVYLISATLMKGRKYTFKKIDSTENVITINSNGIETIDSDLTFNLELQHETVTIISDGSNWWII